MLNSVTKGTPINIWLSGRNQFTLFLNLHFNRETYFFFILLNIYLLWCLLHPGTMTQYSPVCVGHHNTFKPDETVCIFPQRPVCLFGFFYCFFVGVWIKSLSSLLLKLPNFTRQRIKQIKHILQEAKNKTKQQLKYRAKLALKERR